MVFSLPLLFLGFPLKNHGIRDGNPILTGKCGPTGLPPRVKERKDQTEDESRLPSPLYLADNSAESLGPITFFFLSPKTFSYVSSVLLGETEISPASSPFLSC